MIFGRKFDREIAEARDQIQRDFHTTFTSVSGQRVLQHLAFIFCALTDEKTTKAESVTGMAGRPLHPEWKEVFWWILAEMGLNTGDNIGRVIAAMVKIPRTRPEDASQELVQDLLEPGEGNDIAEWRGRPAQSQ